jgi:hypothetical protein
MKNRTIPTDLLKRQVTPAEAETAYLATNLLAQMQPGDELWEYRTPPETWGRMCGSAGLVLLRRGKVVADLLTEFS